MNELDCIKQAALSLSIGENEKVYCPFCDNIEPYAPSLSVTRIAEGILYHCYRAVCSGQGFIGTLPSNLLKDKNVNLTVKLFKPKPYEKETTHVLPVMVEYIGKKYCISCLELERNNIRQTGGTDEVALVMPLYSREGYEFGHTTKIIHPNGTQLKAIHYLTTDTCKLHYARHYPSGSDLISTGTTVILVEDVLSAIRVSEFRQGVALLGTHLNDAMIQDLLKAGYKNVILALDPDAVGKALKMKEKYSLFFNTWRVPVLTKDPKDLGRGELQKELGL